MIYESVILKAFMGVYTYIVATISELYFIFEFVKKCHAFIVVMIN